MQLDEALRQISDIRQVVGRGVPAVFDHVTWQRLTALFAFVDQRRCSQLNSRGIGDVVAGTSIRVSADAANDAAGGRAVPAQRRCWSTPYVVHLSQRTAGGVDATGFVVPGFQPGHLRVVPPAAARSLLGRIVLRRVRSWMFALGTGR